MDHSRALRASVDCGPFAKGWKRRAGRPRHTWLRTVESDLAPLSIGLATAYHRAQNRQAWSKLVGNGNVRLWTSHMMMMMNSRMRG